MADFNAISTKHFPVYCMANYSEEQSLEAKKIVDTLLPFDQGKPRGESEDSRRVPIELSDDVVISDLESDAYDFIRDLDILSDLDYGVPAMRLDGDEDTGSELVPVSLELVLPSYPFSNGLGQRHPFRMGTMLYREIYYWLRDIIRELKENDDNNLEFISIENARSTFKKRATDFLATRIAAVRNAGGNNNGNGSFLNLFKRAGGGGSIVTTSGCLFSVTTNTPGLRVSWSAAYRISPNYFAHPTTPATGVLQSGKYIFAVDGGAYTNMAWDKVPATLPGKPSIHLNF